MSEIISISIIELMEKTERWLLDHDYKKSTIGVYKATWNKFRVFSASPFYDRDTAKKFLFRYFGIDENAVVQKCDKRMQQARRHMLMVPVSKMSNGLYGIVNMLLKCVFYSAVESNVIKDNPAACINPRGGKAKKEKVALTDKQISTLLGTIKNLPPYLFVMLGLYAGLRREEILGLQWDCVHIDDDIPYISVRRAWRSVKNRPEVTTLLKTPAAKRDIPIPQLLVDCLKAEKEKSLSDYVISDSNGEPLSDSQFCRLWHYITARRVKERKIYRYINGEKIHHTISPKLGERCRTNKSIYYTLDFHVTPHLLRHTYITNLIHEGVDPKTVQYLAGHENSKVTMDIYAKVKYNKPWELAPVINQAFSTNSEKESA